MNSTNSHIDNSSHAQIEISTVFGHLLRGSSINCDEAYTKYGVKHLHSVIPKLERFIPIERKDISRPHPERGYLRQIKKYWIEPHVIEMYSTQEGRAKLIVQQTSIHIAKSRTNDNKAFKRLCSYCSYETMTAKLHDIYGRQAANDN